MRISSKLFNAGGNFARPTKYRAIITPPLSITSISPENLDVLCQNISMPGIQNENYEIKIKGHPLKIPGRSIQSQELNMTFYVDEGFLVRQMFNDWIAVIDNRYNVPGDNPMPMDQPPQGKYGFVDLIAEDYQETGYPPMILRFVDVYPTNVGELTFDTGDKDNVMSLNVTFAYRKFIPV